MSVTDILNQLTPRGARLTHGAHFTVSAAQGIREFNSMCDRTCVFLNVCVWVAEEHVSTLKCVSTRFTASFYALEYLLDDL